MPKKNKFNAVKTKGSDSKLENRIYQILKENEILGLEIEREPKFELLPSFRNHNKKDKIRAITFKPDFKIKYGLNEYIIEVKGMETEAYKLREKLFLFKNPDLNFVKIRTKKEIEAFLNDLIDSK